MKLRIDPKAVEFLQELGKKNGRTLLHSLIQIYAEDMSSEVRKIEKLLSAGELREAARRADFLKTSSSNLGLTELSNQFEALAYLGNKSNPEPEKMRAAFADTSKMIEPYFEALKELCDRPQSTD